MSNWKLVRAADFIDFNPYEHIEKGAMTKKVGMEQLQPFARDILSYEIVPFTGGSKFRNGDTLMARITPCLENGKTAQVNILNDGEVGFGSTEFIVLRAIPDVSDKNFIYYLTISSILREKAIKSMVGSSGRQRVQQGVINDMEFFAPPLAEQIKIGRILQTLDNKIAINTKINNHLEQIAQAIFKSWFVDFEPFGGKMPKDWREGILSDIATVMMGQSPAGTTFNTDGIGTVFYQGRAEFGFRFPSRRLFTTQSKRMAMKGDVLVSIRAPVGDLNVAFEPCCLGRGLAAIQSNNCQSFILYTMFVLKRVLNIYNGEGTVFGSINKDDMMNLPILIPSSQILQRFEVLVNPIDAAIETNYVENCHLQNLRDALLPRLMSGEIDVSQFKTD